MKKVFVKDTQTSMDNLRKTGLYTVYKANALYSVLAVTNKTGTDTICVQFLIDESGTAPIVKRRQSVPDGEWSDWVNLPLP